MMWLVSSELVVLHRRGPQRHRVVGVALAPVGQPGRRVRPHRRVSLGCKAWVATLWRYPLVEVDLAALGGQPALRVDLGPERLRCPIEAEVRADVGCAVPAGALATEPAEPSATLDHGATTFRAGSSQVTAGPESCTTYAQLRSRKEPVPAHFCVQPGEP